MKFIVADAVIKTSADANPTANMTMRIPGSLMLGSSRGTAVAPLGESREGDSKAMLVADRACVLRPRHLIGTSRMQKS
ncbi:MAG: hypothetical protein ABL901_03235 [Hyphomicrobiaceae bacterium]